MTVSVDTFLRDYPCSERVAERVRRLNPDVVADGMRLLGIRPRNSSRVWMHFVDGVSVRTFIAQHGRPAYHVLRDRFPSSIIRLGHRKLIARKAVDDRLWFL